MWALTVTDAQGKIAQNLNRTVRAMYGADPWEHDHQFRNRQILYRW